MTILITDLDGCLINDNYVESLYDTLSEIHLMGFKTIITTGRRPQALEVILDDPDFNKYICGITLANGCVKVINNNYIFEFMPKDMVVNLKRMLKKLNLDYYLDLPNGTFNCRQTENLLLDSVYSIRLIVEDMDRITNLLNFINSFKEIINFLIWKNENGFYIEIIPSKCDKWESAKEICSMCNLSGDIITVGNDINDLSILQKGDYSIYIGKDDLLSAESNVVLSEQTELITHLKELNRI